MLTGIWLDALYAAQRSLGAEGIQPRGRVRKRAQGIIKQWKKENKERGLQYQVITNTAKIKKMSKKQLRSIKKADTSGVKPKVIKS